jgi:hypothetical protein
MAQTVPFGISAPSAERTGAAAQTTTRFLDISNEVGHVKSVQLLFLLLLHTLLHCCSPAVCFGGRCAAILGLFSVSNLRARFVSLIDSVLSTSHLSDHVRP